MKNVFYLLTFLFVSCAQPSKDNEKTEHSYFKDDLIDLLDAQDRRDGKKVATYLESNDEIIREKAALAFASIQDRKYKEKLIQTLEKDHSFSVQSACVYSLGQLRDSSLSEFLINKFHNAPGALHHVYLDAIGKCGASNSLSFFNELANDSNTNDYALSQGLKRIAYSRKNYAIFKPHILHFLASDHVETRKNAASMLIRVFKNKSNLSNEESQIMEELLLKEEDQHTLNMLLNFMNIEGEKQEMLPFNEESREKYWQLKKLYTKALFLQKLIVNEYNGMDFLMSIALDEKETAVRTSAANSMIKALSNPNFIVNNKPKSTYLTALLSTNDMALQSVATYGIKDTSIISKEEAKIVFLEKLKLLESSFEIPRQKETHIDVINTIAYLEDKPKPKIETKYNNPIDWEFVKSIAHNQKVKITTSKGDIIIECKVNDAPGSVSNFLKLVDSGYYNNKAFHRVVPNFVIQTGCSRGDGWGAPNWTQRSEFSNYLSYTTGAVGLASSGKDTESVQWFITHTYTPFLDGRYSIFAFVVEGMDVVNKMQVGDIITTVERI